MLLRKGLKEKMQLKSINKINKINNVTIDSITSDLLYYLIIQSISG